MSAAEDATLSSPQAIMPLLRNRDYLLLWGGQTVSTLGSGISGLAFPLLVLSLTHSASKTGFAAALFGLPYIVVSLPAGALVDRWNRKLVMVASDATRALNMAAIPLMASLGHLSLAQIYAAALIEGTAFTFFNLAEVAALPRVIDKLQIPNAIAQSQAAQTGTQFVAPPLGGLIFQAVSRTAPFALDAVSYGLSVLSLLFIRTEFQLERREAPKRLLNEIGEGVAWLWKHPLIRYMTVLSGSLNFCTNAMFLLLLFLAEKQGASPLLIGIMFAIGSAGAFVGSLLAPRIQRSFGYAQVIVTTVWITALVAPLFALAPNTVVLGLLAAAEFVTLPIYTTMQFSHRVSLIPDELQGRVNSAVRLVAFGMLPLGSAVGGILIQFLDLVRAVLVISAIEIALAILTTLNRHVREATPLPESLPS